jgi:hypothetical protein
MPGHDIFSPDPFLDRIYEHHALSAHKEEISKRLQRVKVIYTDVDGTLMGPGGCFFLNSRREYTLGPARTLLKALEQEVDIFLVSGRNRRQLLETARLLGLKNYIAELGAETVYNQGEEMITNLGPFEGKTDHLHDYIVNLGVLDFLFSRHSRQLEPHTPWALDRDCTPLLRGLVDLDEVNRELGEHFPGLVMVDNGIIPREFPGLEVSQVRAYHIMPLGVSKEGAVEQDLKRRGIYKKEAVAIGDSEADLPFAEKVGAFFLVRNGLYASPQIAELIESYDNVFITEGLLNEGWAEAVETIISLSLG